MADLHPEDAKLVTLARSARGRTGAAEGAAVRDTDGRTYVAAGVVPIERSEAELAGLKLAAESTGGRRTRIDPILFCRAPEPSEPAGAGAPQPPGATASGATASGATRVEEPAGAVEG